GGVCIDGVDSFTCECPAGFGGATCETDIDDCAGDPCLNGGVCIDGVDSFTCECPAGYSGDYCQDGGPTTVVCDVDGDGDVDILDINQINSAANTPALPGDPRDADGDGLITVNDARACFLQCTRFRCAP
ncbi:MAG: calcium-binding EGF-like domain-containing protein, partial [Deferrisomatales bacterium]|nr:calcium-binding EGF-like domain-containing protein [Deferrisomatales bacterium]